jgi:acetyl esterase/lipase
MKQVLPVVAIVAWLARSVSAAEPASTPLWPAGAPGAVGTTDADVPSITIHLPETAKRNGKAVLICPGGGYGGLMMSYEGHDIARWLNQQGIAGAVLKYRVGPRYHHPAPFDDATRAMRMLRARSAELAINPRQIGIMGFSAGGHLAATVACHFDTGIADSTDETERQSSRPDFHILVYPVISLKPTFGHGGSRNNLLGPTPPDELLSWLSMEEQVSRTTPPLWITHSVSDTVVQVENSRAYVAACQKQQIPAEYLELPSGQHGLGVGKGPLWEQWQASCAKWLAEFGR